MAGDSQTNRTLGLFRGAIPQRGINAELSRQIEEPDRARDDGPKITESTQLGFTEPDRGYGQQITGWNAEQRGATNLDVGPNHVHMLPIDHWPNDWAALRCQWQARTFQKFSKFDKPG